MLFQRRWCPWTKRSGTWHLFNEDSVLEPSEASLDAFKEKTVSVNQAMRHLTPFQRRWCPWTKQSGTWHLFKEDGALEPSEAALDVFSMKTLSLNQEKQHLTLFQRRRCLWTMRSGTRRLFINPQDYVDLQHSILFTSPSIGLDGEPETIKRVCCNAA